MDIKLKDSKALNSIKNLPQSLEIATKLASDALLLQMYGTRSIPWRIWLNLLSPNPELWPHELTE